MKAYFKTIFPGDPCAGDSNAHCNTKSFEIPLLTVVPSNFKSMTRCFFQRLSRTCIFIYKKLWFLSISSSKAFPRRHF